MDRYKDGKLQVEVCTSYFKRKGKVYWAKDYGHKVWRFWVDADKDVRSSTN